MSKILNEMVQEQLARKHRRGGRSRSGLRIGGVFGFELVRRGRVIDRWVEDNLVVNQGINHILNVAFNAATQVATWYIGIFEGNYTPVAGDTAAGFPAAATESTAYAESTRVTYVEATSTSQSMTNSASPAAFTINATKTIYGAFMSSVSTKSATTGTLVAATRFATSRSVINLDVLNVTYTFNMTAS